MAQSSERGSANELTVCPSMQAFLSYFLKLGTLGFGGPIALAGHMQKDLVEERKWVSSQDYVEGLAFSQLSPGPLAAQLAMYLAVRPYHEPDFFNLREMCWEWLISDCGSATCRQLVKFC